MIQLRHVAIKYNYGRVWNGFRVSANIDVQIIPKSAGQPNMGRKDTTEKLLLLSY